VPKAILSQLRCAPRILPAEMQGSPPASVRTAQQFLSCFSVVGTFWSATRTPHPFFRITEYFENGKVAQRRYWCGHSDADHLHEPESTCGTRGFSTLELLTTVCIVFVVLAMAVIQLQPTWQQIQADVAKDQVKSTLRQARELAISERRTIVVQFLNAANGTACPAFRNDWSRKP
jgi:hypothetical protein